MTPTLEGGQGRRRAATGRGLTLIVALAAAACLSLTQLAGVARADGGQLCDGYAGCSAGAFTVHGYQSAAASSWWRMFPGVNCTNYAAFVESQVYGVPAPAALLGNAYQWAASAAAAGIPVDNTPTVGAVAVWAAGGAGIGSLGHVAVVEAVGPGGSYIDISQSGIGSATDGYDWQQIARGSSSWEPWPTSFIHFQGPGIPGTLPPPGQRVAGAEPIMAGYP